MLQIVSSLKLGRLDCSIPYVVFLQIPGVGHQMQKVLAGMNVETIADLEKVTLQQLTERCVCESALVNLSDFINMNLH
jgi:nucleotidyltransferase/DNA polymerase involved in DNA repair